MNKPKKFLTPKQKQLSVRKRQLISFRKWLSLEGNGDAVAEYVGISVWDLRKHIESLWQPDMNWANYRKLWCVDHIIGLQQFDLFNYKETELCWNYNNLQPAYIDDNHAKGYSPEVALKVLLSLPKSVWVNRLIEKVSPSSDMFEKYYSR